MNIQDPSSSAFVPPVDNRRTYHFRSDVSEQDAFGFRYHKRVKRTQHTEVHNVIQPPSPESPIAARTISLLQNQPTQQNPQSTTFQRPITSPIRTAPLNGNQQNPLRNLFFGTPAPAAKSIVEYDAMSASQYPSPEREQNMYSIASTESLNTSRTERIVQELPKADVLNYKYINFIPKNITDTTKFQQLIYWLTKVEMKNERPYVTKHPIVETTKKRLLREIETSNALVSWRKQPDAKRDPVIKPNPINEMNRKRLQSIQESLKVLQDEINDWEKCAEKALDLHVQAWHKLDDLEQNNFTQEYDDSWIEEIDSDQREYINNLIKEEPRYKISDVVASMERDVTQFRSILNTAYKFQNEAAQLASVYNSEYAHKKREQARIVPIQSDEKLVALFKNTQEERRQNEFKNMYDILRLMSRQSKTPVAIQQQQQTEPTVVYQQESEETAVIEEELHYTPMDIDG